MEQHVPEKVPEKTPGAWLTKLSMTAPGLRDRAEGAGLLPGELLLREPQSTWEGRNVGSASGKGSGGAHNPAPDLLPPRKEPGQESPDSAAGTSPSSPGMQGTTLGILTAPLPCCARRKGKQQQQLVLTHGDRV